MRVKAGRFTVEGRSKTKICLLEAPAPRFPCRVILCEFAKTSFRICRPLTRWYEIRRQPGRAFHFSEDS